MIEKIVWLFHFIISMVTLGGSPDITLPEVEREFVDAIYLEVNEIERFEGKVRYSVECWVRNHTDKEHQVNVTVGGVDRYDKPLVSIELAGFVLVGQEVQFKIESSMDFEQFKAVNQWYVQEVGYD